MEPIQLPGCNLYISTRICEISSLAPFLTLVFVVNSNIKESPDAVINFSNFSKKEQDASNDCSDSSLFIFLL